MILTKDLRSEEKAKPDHMAADIISIDNKRKAAEAEKEGRARIRKIHAVRKMFQCAHCGMKCEKCGGPVDDADQAHISHRLPYRFCAACSDEYWDYIERMQGRGDPDCYWHNVAWMDTWKTWIDHQSSKDRYLKTKEFVRLIQEINQLPSDQ